MKRKSDTTIMTRKRLNNTSVRLLALAAAGLLLVSGLTACGASASKSAYVSETMAAASGGMYNEASAEEAVADYDSAANMKMNSVSLQERGDTGTDSTGADGSVDSE